LAIAYHDLDDGNAGRNGEFISPIVGYDAKITAPTIAISDNGGSPDTITDSNSNFVNAGFAVGQEITVSGTASNNITATLTAVAAGTLTMATGTFSSSESAGNDVTIVSGSGVTVRVMAIKKAEVIDKSANELESDGKFISSNLNDEPEFASQFHNALVSYAISKGYEMIPSKEGLQAATYWFGQYSMDVKKAKAFADNNQVYGPRKVGVNPTTGII
jgi:hypothetical protein